MQCDDQLGIPNQNSHYCPDPRLREARIDLLIDPAGTAWRVYRKRDEAGKLVDVRWRHLKPRPIQGKPYLRLYFGGKYNFLLLSKLVRLTFEPVLANLKPGPNTIRRKDFINRQRAREQAALAARQLDYQPPHPQGRHQ